LRTLEGRIIKGVGGLYTVKTEDGAYTCPARGKFRIIDTTPLTGDFTVIEVVNGDEKKGYLLEIKPRRNEVTRPRAANIDVIIAVFSVREPAPSFTMLDNVLICCEWQVRGAEIVICVNKADISDEGINEIERVYKNVYTVIPVSALTGLNINSLKDTLRGKTAMLAGPSGVGKSSLLNAIVPNAMSETGEISRKLARGKHTTRHTEFFTVGDERDGTLIADTPGFSHVSADIVPKDELELCFPEFEPFLGKCRYSNCKHVTEDGCAVKEAAGGAVSEERFERYAGLRI
jgi:ribosome biogenesis GTPase